MPLNWLGLALPDAELERAVPDPDAPPPVERAVPDDAPVVRAVPEDIVPLPGKGTEVPPLGRGVVMGVVVPLDEGRGVDEDDPLAEEEELRDVDDEDAPFTRVNCGLWARMPAGLGPWAPSRLIWKPVPVWPSSLLAGLTKEPAEVATLVARVLL